ncbi:hypothetical protein [Chenggangzhangella methanolivorans]|nr:hypothetical protein [Chenggangzhangella methanolivorans]
MAILRPVAVGAALLSLAACAPEAPNAYSPGYSRVTLADGGADGKVRKGYDQAGRARQTALLPDACVTPDTAPDPMYLPSGCANAVNLQQMAEREEDLERGREPGPSMAAPSARAARRYIDGAGDDERRGRLNSEYSSGTQVFSGGSVSGETTTGR